jgi:hypothetical protein
MTDRIKNDDTLEEPTNGYIENPAIIVHRADNGEYRYIIGVGVADESADDPTLFGIMMSDLLDHIAAAYHGTTGRDERDIRAQLFKVMRDEDRFKEKDPTRGNARGRTFLGARS